MPETSGGGGGGIWGKLGWSAIKIAGGRRDGGNDRGEGGGLLNLASSWSFYIDMFRPFFDHGYENTIQKLIKYTIMGEGPEHPSGQVQDMVVPGRFKDMFPETPTSFSTKRTFGAPFNELQYRDSAAIANPESHMIMEYADNFAAMLNDIGLSERAKDLEGMKTSLTQTKSFQEVRVKQNGLLDFMDQMQNEIDTNMKEWRNDPVKNKEWNDTHDFTIDEYNKNWETAQSMLKDQFQLPNYELEKRFVEDFIASPVPGFGGEPHPSGFIFKGEPPTSPEDKRLLELNKLIPETKSRIEGFTPFFGQGGGGTPETGLTPKPVEPVEPVEPSRIKLPDFNLGLGGGASRSLGLGFGGGSQSQLPPLQKLNLRPLGALATEQHTPPPERRDRSRIAQEFPQKGLGLLDF